MLQIVLTGKDDPSPMNYILSTLNFRPDDASFHPNIGNPNYTFGNAYFSGEVKCAQVNGVAIRSSGDGSQFLADDGEYHDLQLDNYLRNSGGSISGKLWMNLHKIHLDAFSAGVSGISYTHTNGVLIESANSVNENSPNIELYAKDDGNILLHTTEGKAIYKDNEIATVNDVSVVNERVNSLESII
ncbi:MAG: hypothetical protein LUD15_08570, partial [Bacteroides sp.]|nr:hypothetical protein [Bacteroides sp.]